MYRPADRSSSSEECAPIFNKLTERDLRRVYTNRMLAPPPADRENPVWHEAWVHFELIYSPALRRYVYNVLRSQGVGATAIEDARDIVRDFVCRRLQDGKLNAQGAPIRRFRDWLACQVRRFTLDWLRKQSTLKNKPKNGFADCALLANVKDVRANAAALESFSEQLVAEIVRVVVDRVAKGSERRAQILRDLILHDGQQSPHMADLLGVPADNVRDIRRRARNQFREELIKLVMDGPFAEGDIEDLIAALKRQFGAQPAARAT